ncbi:uncharacterized protein LOC122929233 isoform X2 [Bufo gargarizans]|uniref:uncharacterized protein LOC122929233 isoform X2 n=1 Tax=Bufo gargarizans TaxID=30331 RepID=UPI001CF1FC1A|nr:uncharacterized protein LOC122929233 isoform X2 [Bufo gargarizans]
MYSAACTQRINENIVSVTVNSSDEFNGFYCYSINGFVGGANYTRRTNTGTQLLILKPSGASNINQTMEVEVNGSVIINCSFSIQDMISTINVGKRSVLWTQVYWMVGEPREHFVYHPNEDYIHPDYKGKTKLIGRSDLLLEDFQGPDYTTLYCRVAVRFCLQNTKTQNPVETILQEGPGTVLRVRETTQSIPEASTSLVPTIVVVSCVEYAVVLFLVLLIICLNARKGMKRTDAGETIPESIDLSVYQNSAYENIERIQRKATGTDDNTVYAVVKPFATTAKKPPVSEQSEDDKIVYAVVKHSATTTAKKPPGSEQSEVVYTSVKKR